MTKGSTPPPIEAMNVHDFVHTMLRTEDTDVPPVPQKTEQTCSESTPHPQFSLQPNLLGALFVLG